VKILLDTHFTYWLGMRESKLESREIDVLSEADAEILASAVSLWELRIKWNLFHVSGTRKGPADPTQLLTALAIAEIPVLALSPEQAATSLATPIEHRDPFDELLLIQAQEMGARLLTRDGRLLDHPLVLQL
jgi:PIN domain nuclease of toxin-antitoxin system